MVPLSNWIILSAFFSMHFVTGLILSAIFQTAHVQPTSEFPKADKDGLIAGNWTVHQLATTSNYAPASRIFSWFVGGLNFQIEHHLMPHICHVHYRALSRIVKETAARHGIPYHSRRTFVDALKDHASMLYQLGNPEKVKQTI
jgi:linoleoyl-CoA desaturase